jgi:hypothetical protein
MIVLSEILVTFKYFKANLFEFPELNLVEFYKYFTQ